MVLGKFCTISRGMHRASDLVSATIFIYTDLQEVKMLKAMGWTDIYHKLTNERKHVLVITQPKLILLGFRLTCAFT